GVDDDDLTSDGVPSSDDDEESEEESEEEEDGDDDDQEDGSDDDDDDDDDEEMEERGAGSLKLRPRKGRQSEQRPLASVEMRVCEEILDQLIAFRHSWPFRQAAEAEMTDETQDYRRCAPSRPVDLASIRLGLRAGRFDGPGAFLAQAAALFADAAATASGVVVASCARRSEAFLARLARDHLPRREEVEEEEGGQREEEEEKVESEEEEKVESEEAKEIDKIWLACRLFNPGLPRPFALCLREVRLRLDLSPCPAPDVATATPASPAPGHTPPAPAANQRRPLLIRALAQVCSVQVDRCSVMLLQALLPGALTHTSSSSLSVLLTPSTTGIVSAELCVAELCLSLSLTAQVDLTSLKVATLDLRLGKLVAGLHGVAAFDPEAEGGVATPHAGRPPPEEGGGRKVTTSDLMWRLPELTSVQVNNVSVTATLAQQQRCPVVMATRLVECRLTLCPPPPQRPAWGEGLVGG
ncbi:unnamed protein product, partial [Lampetra fluviatilis]